MRLSVYNYQISAFVCGLVKLQTFELLARFETVREPIISHSLNRSNTTITHTGMRYYVQFFFFFFFFLHAPTPKGGRDVTSQPNGLQEQARIVKSGRPIKVNERERLGRLEQLSGPGGQKQTAKLGQVGEDEQQLNFSLTKHNEPSEKKRKNFQDDRSDSKMHKPSKSKN